MTTEQYLQLNRKFRSEILGMRGNIENKRQLEEIQRANGFTSIGQALDYVLTVFTSMPDAATLHEHEQKLKAEIYALQNNNIEKNDVIKTLTARIDELEKEKESTSVFITDALSGELETLREQVQQLLQQDVTPSQFMFMVVEFVKGDPGEKIANLLKEYQVENPAITEAVNDLSFPLRSTIEKLYPHLFNLNNNNNETEQQQPAAATSVNTGTGAGNK